MYKFLLLTASCFLTHLLPQDKTTKQKIGTDNKIFQTEWILNNLKEMVTGNILYEGNPEIIESKYGKAICFNGSTDGIFLENMPLEGLKQITIEVVFKPDSGGGFEQRFLHFGEVQGDRVLLELRSKAGSWYLDTFIKSGDQQCTLIDPSLIHKTGEWYHVAYVINNNKFISYVNGEKELEGKADVLPLKTGRTSIGFRQNKVAWYKGCIYKIRVTGKALTPEEFIKY